MFRSPRVSRTLFHIYARHIYFRAFRVNIGLRVFLPPYPTRLPHVISVRQANVLLTASFRFRLITDTLAVRLMLPLTGRIKDFFRRRRKAPLRVCALPGAPKKTAAAATYSQTASTPTLNYES